MEPKLRARMVDWMVECLTVFKKREETFFLSAYLLDYYLSKTDRTHVNGDVHLLGMCSMFIASKFCDIYFVNLFELCDKIGHSSYGPKFVKKTEV